jgi:hypothetical protein
MGIALTHSTLSNATEWSKVKVTDESERGAERCVCVRARATMKYDRSTVWLTSLLVFMDMIDTNEVLLVLCQRPIVQQSTELIERE